MSATLAPPERPAAAPASARVPDGASSARWRTPVAALASGLGVLPLVQIFTDTGWLVQVWISIAALLLPAFLLRLRSAPRAWHVLPGVVLLVLWLTARFAGDHAVAGIIPTPSTWDDVSRLMSDLHRTTNAQSAPLHTTLAVRFTLCLVLALVAAVIDLVAVVARRGALAGVPLLVIYTVSGAVPREPVAWWLFLGAAGGFLLLLGLDARDEVHRWGRFMPRSGGTRTGRGLGVSGQRVAAVAIAIAVIVPLVLPSHPRNLLADALHHSNPSGVDGLGPGSGRSLDPYASLSGALRRPKPVKLATVQVSNVPSGAGIYYLRANVLDSFDGAGWRPAGNDFEGPSVRDNTFATTPPEPDGVHRTAFTAQISIAALEDNPPVFGSPTKIEGLPGEATWDRGDQIVFGTTTERDLSYREEVAQLDPTPQQLQAATDASHLPGIAHDAVRPNVPSYVTDLVARLTRGLSAPYAKAKALTDYFTDAKNGFVYSLATRDGDSGSRLVDFLKSKQGFCQQYAGALAVMLRLAGVPSRVVLGYTHDDPDQSKSFDVMTNNAHAWVEAYLGGVGWLPLDPTPLAVGTDGGATASLPWAPHILDRPSGSSLPTHTQRPTAGTSVATVAPTQAPAATGGSSGGPDLAPILITVVIVAAVLAVLLTPAAVRWRRRRRRLAGPHPDPDQLWTELSDTAVDLGYAWSSARTPRQVASWLDREVGGAALGPPLHALAGAVETARYAPGRTGPAGGPDLVTALRTVSDGLWASRSRTTRLRARFAPPSLRWSWLRGVSGLAAGRRATHAPSTG